MSDFIKFPRTPHLLWLSNKPVRDDRVLSKVEAGIFLETEIIVEEKVDGANVGISVAEDGSLRVQNRGSYLEQPSPMQFRPIWQWLANRRVELVKRLGSELIVFGEWSFAVHSAYYDRLPDWFLGFDVYDRKSKRFWPVTKRNQLFKDVGLATIPLIERKQFSITELLNLLQSAKSSLGPEPIEGIYLRRESENWLEGRAKIVRPQFLQNIHEHWSDRPLEKNVLVR